MAETTWKQAVYDIADAYREAEGTEDKISIANLKEKVREGSSKVTLDGEKVKELAMTSYKGANPLTIGADGAIFDPNVLLQAGLQIINGVNGEDLTDPIALLSDAVAENLRLAKSKYSESKNTGTHVWKQLTAEDEDFVDYVVSDIEDTYPDGGTQDGYWYEKITSYTGANPLTIGEAGATIPANTLLETALQIVNGVEPGVSGIDYGEITFSSGTTSFSVNHNLDKTPSLAVLAMVDGIDGTTIGTVYCIGVWNFAYSLSGIKYTTSTRSNDANTVTFNVNSTFIAGKKYLWIAVA